MYKLHLIDFLFFKKFIGVYLIYNVALVSAMKFKDAYSLEGKLWPS